ncbi:MAG: hypothetical protein JSR70_07535 [Proteobacteria bacterium]|nr:hypothetical protein [Pseudomonadota bacterium]
MAIGQGPCKITGKASSANIQARLFNDIFFNGSLAAGETMVAVREVEVAIPATPFQITVANAATFVEDLEVVDAATGLPFTKVASAPATGQYSVSSGGVFTFAAADTGKFPLITYSYTVAASGQTLTFNQQLVGAAPTFQLVLAGGYTAAGASAPSYPGLKLFACVAQKLSFAAKQNDFAMPNFEFQCMANAAGQVGTWSTTDARG